MEGVFSDLLQVLNVLLLCPVLAYVMRIEHRLTKLEGLSARVDKMEGRWYAKTAEKPGAG